MNQNNQMPGQHPPELSRGSSLRFSEIWKIIRFRRWLVLLILCLSTLGTFLGHFIYTPTYKAVSTISVKTEKSKSMADVLGAANPWGENDNISERIHNYTQYIKSNDFLLEMAQALKFRQANQRLVFEAPQNLSILRKEFWIWAFQHFTGKQLRKNIEKYDPMVMPIESIAGFLSSVVAVTTNHATHITIEVTTLDAYTSMTIANAIAAEFTEKTNSHDARGLLEVKKLLEDKLEATKANLKKAELELIEFKKQNRISITTSQSSIYSERINSIEKQIETINIKLDENERLSKYYKTIQKKNLSSALGAQSSQSNDGVRTQIALFNQKLDDLKKQKSLMLSQNYGDDHWRVKEVSEKINRIARGLKTLMGRVSGDAESDESNINVQKKLSSLTTEIRLLKTKLGPLQKTKSELLTYLNQIPEAEQYQLMLDRKVSLEYENFSLLRTKMNDIEIQLVSLDKKVLIDRLSSLPAASKRRSLFIKMLFSALVGTFFGCMVAILLETLDSSIRHKSDLEDLGIHFLGEIPDTSHGSKKPTIKSPAQLVTLNNPDSLDSVVFDFVRSRLESDRARNGRNSSSMAITSVRPGEGKSFISSNLAVSLSQLGKKTLLLDTDLRCPSVHSYFNLTNDQGLTDLFESNVGLDEVLHKSVTPNLDIFTAGWGCKNPTVLVSSEKFRILMKFLRSEYDYVIVDTPPIGAVADASIISNMTDGITMVARYRQTTKNDIQDALFKIQQMSTKRVFGVINFASSRENIVTYYPYVVPKGTSRSVSSTSTKRDDIQRFEDQLKRKKSG